jgi:hypothetical protein
MAWWTRSLRDEHDTAEQNHRSECRRATHVTNSGVLGRPHRSALPFVPLRAQQASLKTLKVFSHTSPAVGPLRCLAGLPWVRDPRKISLSSISSSVVLLTKEDGGEGRGEEAHRVLNLTAPRSPS